MSAVATPPAPHPAPRTPSPPGPKPWGWTVADYYKLGEHGFFAGKRVELVRGEILEMSPINIAHATAVGLVTDAVTAVFLIGHFVNVQQPFSVPTAPPGSEPQPDVSVIPGSRRPAPVGHPTAAALLVEVADSTRFYDTTTKAELYATAGVADYWVLDLTNRVLLAFRDPKPVPDAGQAYATRQTFGPADSVAPLAAPTAAVRVADLLP